ncbi:hypothetical protein K3495_g14948 [Podosphaera aphanis]|nr:hypothetical protein K3495_g14948 [Podosphaera aphanis]
MREYSQDKRVHSVLDENEESHYIGQKYLSEANDFHDLQAGHSSRTAGMIYGRDLMESLFHTLNQREGFRRGIQRPVLNAIKQRQSPIVTIIGTGGGKSLLFMLPASCSRDGVTIVIVPLIALRSDLKDRCDKAGISCVEWDSKRPADWSNIVLVTPEAAVGDKFSCFIDRRRAMEQLDRIVIDECHLVLGSKSGWRTQIMDLANMTKKHIQLLYLTATLPPSDEKEFYRLMGLEELDNLGQVNLFRDQTIRKNVGYSVLEYRKEDEDEAVRMLVEEKKEYPMPGQIVVYCSTIDQAMRLGGVLKCRTFHRNIGNLHEKRIILDKLTNGTEQVFTATNALGLGIDAPSIRVVIHLGIRQKLRDYAQESGRAGRDGKKSEAIIVRAQFSDHQGRRRIDQGYKDTEDEMKVFV